MQTGPRDAEGIAAHTIRRLERGFDARAPNDLRDREHQLARVVEDPLHPRLCIAVQDRRLGQPLEGQDHVLLQEQEPLRRRAGGCAGVTNRRALCHFPRHDQTTALARPIPSRRSSSGLSTPPQNAAHSGGVTVADV